MHTMSSTTVGEAYTAPVVVNCHCCFPVAASSAYTEPSSLPTNTMPSATAAADAQLDQEFDIGHRTLRNTFDHMNLVVRFWTGMMVGQSVPYASNRAAVDDLLTQHARAYDQFETVAREFVAAGRLDETFVDHYDVRQSFGATILHVIDHNVQHRGEVLHILQRLGVPDLPEGNPQEWEHMTGRIQQASARG